LLAEEAKLHFKRMSAAPKDKNRGKRYTEDQKKEILGFIESHNASNGGRGGQSAASKKYKISAITLGSWLKASSSGAAVPGKRGRKAGSASKAGGSSFSAKIKVLSKLAAEIDSAEENLQQLRQKFNALKGGL